MSLEIDYDFSRDRTLRCRGKEDTDKQGFGGEYFGNFYVKDTKWALVLWDSDEDPSLYKAELLEIEERIWMDAD